MAGRRSFKSDTSFLEKISMGAIGTQKIIDDLRSHGHMPIELERGSTSFKIWKEIKIKRIRVPDILCVNCGRRIESRAKTKMEITMSHSFSDPERGWDFGLNDSDYVGLVVCRRSGERPIDWEPEDPVQYISVRDLHELEETCLAVMPKGAEEGFETRITWPSSVANYPGKVISVDAKKLKYRRDEDNRTISLAMVKKEVQLHPLVERRDKVIKNQILASVIPVYTDIKCSDKVTPEYYIEKSSSPSLSERYASVKALSFFDGEEVIKTLIKKTKEEEEHIYIRLEAAGGLARKNVDEGWQFIIECLNDHYLQNKLESVIILAEIPSDESCNLLCKVLLDEGQHPEIRAGAAWALGEISNKNSLKVLIDSFTAFEKDIKIEAARAVAKLSSEFATDVIDKFYEVDDEKRQGVAWALSKSGSFEVDDLIRNLENNDVRKWISYIIGTQDETRYIDEIEKLKVIDPEVYFAVTVLWKIMTSWVFGLEEYG